MGVENHALVKKLLYKEFFCYLYVRVFTMKKLSIVIPAKNEEKRIAKTLSNYGAYFSVHRNKNFDIEIIVVVNASTDSTAKIVDRYAEKYSFIKKLETPYKSGKGGAVAYGFKEASGDYIGYADADGAVPASEIYRLYEFIDETPWLDAVVGSRELSQIKISLRRRLLMLLFNLYVRLLFQLPYNDTQCAAKIFKKRAAKSVASKLSNTGWAFDVNLLLLAKYLNFQVMERPVKWSEKEGSKFSIYAGLIKVPLEFLSLKRLETKFHLNNIASKLFKHTIERNSGSKGSKKVLILAWRDIKHPEAGGSEVYVHQIAKRLAKTHSVVLFTSRPGNLAAYDEIDGVSIFRKGTFITVYIWAFLYYIFYFRNKIDIIIDVENGLPFFTPFYSTKPKIMLLHHVHKGQWFKQFGLPVALFGYLTERFVMPTAYNSVPVVTVSPSSMYELRGLGFNDKRIFLAYNSIPPKVGGFFPKSKTPLLVYVGRVKAYKRLEIAIKALYYLQKVVPETSLVIAGAGDNLGNLEDYAKKLGVLNKITFEGFISERRKWELLQKAWVFLMPSSKEGWGITIVEASAAGTPAVGFNVPGVRDSIVDNVTGVLCQNENDFYSQVARLLADQKRRNILGSDGKKWASMFSWVSSAKVFESIIENISRSRSLLESKTYPWEVDLRSEAITSLFSNK